MKKVIKRNALIVLSEMRMQNRANTQSKLRLYGMGGGSTTPTFMFGAAPSVAKIRIRARELSSQRKNCQPTARTAALKWTVPNEHSVFDIAVVYAVV